MEGKHKHKSFPCLNIHLCTYNVFVTKPDLPAYKPGEMLNSNCPVKNLVSTASAAIKQTINGTFLSLAWQTETEEHLLS